MFKLAQTGSSDSDGDYAGCIKKGKEAAKVSLDKALRTIRKPKAQEALKSYHIAFVTALQGINPGSNERRMDYERRQQMLKDKAAEAWARFEVEQ
jgi:serine/threonine-protein kinase RIO1